MSNITKNLSKAKTILKAHNVDNMEEYTLINNYGYTFTHKDIRFDARFWENCYGFLINTWSVIPFGTKFDCGKDEVRGDARRFAKEIENELNK